MEPPRAETFELLQEQLNDGNPDQRRHAARALAQYRHAGPALAARLQLEGERNVREALFSGLVKIGGHRTPRLVTPFLRAQDAGLRNGAMEALKRMAAAAAPAIDPLLHDEDPDIRMLAIEVTRGWPRLLAEPRLRNLIAHDPHVNVCAAAVDVATENGTATLLPALAAARQRFADEPFLVFAVDIARARIAAAEMPN
jgi:HEAT repeat protein